MDTKPQNLPQKADNLNTSSDDSADSSDTDSASSVELKWRPKPYYFCAKCLQALDLPEPQEEANFLVNKENIKPLPAVEKEPVEKEVVEKKIPVKCYIKKAQAKKPEPKKPRRLLLD